MIQLLSTDFDGTLVDHDRKPPVLPEMFEVLAAMKRNGMQWAVNTGRTLGHLEEGLRREYRFPVHPDYAVVEERDIFRWTADDRWEPFEDWNGQAARDHVELFHLAAPLLAEVLKFLARVEGAEPIYDRGRFIGAVTRTTEDMDKLCRYLDGIRERLQLFAYQRNTIYVRFCHHAYSKGTALGELCRLLGVSREKVMAVGDHHNDLPMLDGKFAAFVTCPGNSCEEVKLAVRVAGGYLAKGHASAGVLEAMKYFGFLAGVLI